jgi:hypothetical protein
MDLEGSDRGVRISGSRARNKRGFLVLGKNNLMCLFSTLSSFQPSWRVAHENMGSDFILETTNKSFMEECI